MTGRAEVVVSTVSFSAESLELTFMELPTDVRSIAGSPVAKMTSVIVETQSPAYADQITELRQAAESLVADLLDDWGTATPVADTEEDDDDERGMGE